jgi:hypothetical protein
VPGGFAIRAFGRGPKGRRPVALGANAGEEGLGGLVGRVLRDELAAEGTLEDRRAERL